MPEKRPLRQEECNINLKSIKRIKEENQDMEIQIRDIDHKVNYILPFSIRQQQKDFLKNKRLLNQTIFQNNHTLIQLQQQLEEGVIMKQKEDKKNGIQTTNSNGKKEL